MSFEIEIQEGHNGGSYFWFRPVIFKRHDKVGYDDVVELEEEFSIEEENPKYEYIKILHPRKFECSKFF